MTTDDVAADMERIFEPLAGRSLVLSSRDFAKRSSPARWRAAFIVFFSLILCITAALAVGFALNDPPRPVALKTTAEQPATVAPVRMIPVPTVRAMATQMRPATATEKPVVAARKVKSVNRVPPSSLTSAVSAARTPRPELHSRPNGSLSNHSERQETASRPASRGCQQGDQEDWCIYQDVLSADRRLRLAYSRAERAGVPLTLLSRFSKNWNRARDHADDDPEGTMQRYEQLADAVDEARLEVGR